MKKLILFFVLAVFAGLMLSSCGEGEESGIGIIKLTNNSSVTISYWSLKKGGSIVYETRDPIYPESSASYETATGSYTIYLEDIDGDGWVTKNTQTVKKDATVEVKYPGNFDFSN
jgi:hypothetical protein